MGGCFVGEVTTISKIQEALKRLGAAGEGIANVRAAAAAVSHEIPNKHCLS